MTDIEQALAEAHDAALIDHQHDHLAPLTIRRDHLAAQTFRSCAAAILASEPMQAIAREAAVGRAVLTVGQVPAEQARDIMRRHGFVFDKWPPDADRPAEHLDRYDDVTKWQGLAFSLYTTLVEYESAIAAVLTEDEQTDNRGGTP